MARPLSPCPRPKLRLRCQRIGEYYRVDLPGGKVVVIRPVLSGVRRWRFIIQVWR